MKNSNAHLWIPVLLFVFVSSTAFPQEVTVGDLVQSLDELYRSESSYALMEMQIVTPHWERTLRMKAWTLGSDKTFIRIIEPKKESGMATLRVGDEMWNYLPNTNKVMKIPPSMMMGSWMGSDFNNNDLVQEFSLLDDYNARLFRPDTAREGYLYLEAIPKAGRPIVWGKQISILRKSDFLPVREMYYDEKGTLMRELVFRDITTFEDRKIPAVMEMIPRNEKGNRTTIRYLEARFNIDVEEEIFSLRNLRSG